MKNLASNPQSGALPRRDLMAIFAYIGRQRGPGQCVDGSFERPEAYLDRLAAAARMQ
jgi:hypothetical protein